MLTPALGIGCPVRSVRRRHSSDFAFPPTTGKSTVFLRNWRPRAEPEKIQNQRERCRGADCVVGSGVYNPAGSHLETSRISSQHQQAFREKIRTLGDREAGRAVLLRLANDKWPTQGLFGKQGSGNASKGTLVVFSTIASVYAGACPQKRSRLDGDPWKIADRNNDSNHDT